MLAVVYNGFGNYQVDQKLQRGMTLAFGGLDFWLPYKGLAYFPDFYFREVDHPATAEAGETAEGEGPLIYRSVMVPGNRLATELTEKGNPFTNKDRGVFRIAITPAKRLNSYLTVSQGVSIDGEPLLTEVQEIRPDREEIELADELAKAHKEQRVNEWLQGKRERMANGQGSMIPAGMIKVFMDELGVRDVDDISRLTMQPNAPLQAAPAAVFSPELRAEMLATLRAEFMQMNREALMQQLRAELAAEQAVPATVIAPVDQKELAV